MKMASLPEPYSPRVASIVVEKQRGATYRVTLDDSRTYTFTRLTPEKIRQLQKILNWFPGCCVTWMRAASGFTLSSPSNQILAGLIRSYGDSAPVDDLFREFCSQFGDSDTIWTFLNRLNDIQSALTFISKNPLRCGDEYTAGCQLDETLSIRFLSSYLARFST